MNIPNNYIDKFEVHPPSRLFENRKEDFEIIKKGICPNCLNKLYETLKGDLRCKSKKCFNKTFIRKGKLLDK